MLSHAKIRGALREAFEEKYERRAVTTVARYVNGDLQLPEKRTHIFIPDCHLISKHDAPAYPNWGFKQERDLRRLMRALTKLKKENPGQLRVWQLGDLFDIWRARGGRGDAVELNDIEADYAPIVDMLRSGPPYGVRAEVVAGNHDFALFELAEWRAARFRIVENSSPGGGDMLAVHGDLFSWLENFVPTKIKAWAVKLARSHASGEKDLFNKEIVAAANRDLEPGDNPIGVGEAELTALAGQTVAGDSNMNVIDAEKGKRKADNKRLYFAAKELAIALRERGYNIKLVVVAHTHWARIVAGRAGSKNPFVLLDAGAWIGRCRIKPNQEKPIHNGQIGVLAGNDLRIYQLGWRTVGR